MNIEAMNWTSRNAMIMDKAKSLVNTTRMMNGNEMIVNMTVYVRRSLNKQVARIKLTREIR